MNICFFQWLQTLVQTSLNNCPSTEIILCTFKDKFAAGTVNQKGKLSWITLNKFCLSLLIFIVKIKAKKVLGNFLVICVLSYGMNKIELKSCLVWKIQRF